MKYILRLDIELDNPADDADARKKARCTVGDLFGATGGLPPNVKVKLQKVEPGKPPKGLRFP